MRSAARRPTSAQISPHLGFVPLAAVNTIDHRMVFRLAKCGRPRVEQGVEPVSWVALLNHGLLDRSPIPHTAPWMFW